VDLQDRKRYYAPDMESTPYTIIYRKLGVFNAFEGLNRRGPKDAENDGEA